MFLISPVLELSLIAQEASRSCRTCCACLPMPPSGSNSHDVDARSADRGRAFALGPYLTALAASPRNYCGDAGHLRRGRPLHRRPQAVIAQHDGRLPLGVFAKEARRPDKLLISRYDGSVTGPDPYPASSRARAMRCSTACAACWPTPCRPISPNSWACAPTCSTGCRRAGRAAMELAQRPGRTRGLCRFGQLAARGAGQEQGLQLIAHGMTDLVTPYLTSRYVIDHLPASLTADRVTLSLPSRRPHDVPARRLSRRPARRRGEALSEGRVALENNTSP